MTDLMLTVTPDRAAPGDTVVLTLIGPVADSWFTSRLPSTLLGRNEDTWEPLFSQSSSGWERLPLPQGQRMVAVPAVAVSGKIPAKVPSAKPGVYRISRQYWRSGSDGIQSATMHGMLTIV